MSTLKAKRAARRSFRGYNDFMAALHEARMAATAINPRWDLGPFTIWARVPAAWCRLQIFGRTSYHPRDIKLPPACYWPEGVWPVGPEYAEPDRAAKRERQLAA